MNESEKKAQHQTVVLFTFSFLTASTYVFMRALAISLFLARVGPDGLPVALAVAAFVVMGVSGLTRIAVRKLPTEHAAVVTWVLLSLVTVLIGITLGPLHHSLIALSALYVFAEVRGSLNTIYVVSLSNKAFAHNDSSRPYAIVASGAPIAGILVGFLLGIEASVVLLMPAIIVTASLDALTAVTVSYFRFQQKMKSEPDRQPQQIPELKSADGPTAEHEPSQSRYRSYLATLMALQIVVVTLVGYQWKVATGNYFGADEVRMLAYFAMFYAVSDTLIVLLQWLVVGRMLDRLGIGIGLIGFPFALGLVAVAAFFAGSPLGLLIVFTLGNGLNVWRRALHDPALTVSFTLVDPQIRPETIVFVKGMVKPFAEAVSGCLLLVLGGVIFEFWITWIWFALTIPWYYFAIRVTMLYRSQKRNGSRAN